MAKKDKNKENKVSTDESTGSKIVTVLIVLVIVDMACYFWCAD